MAEPMSIGQLGRILVRNWMLISLGVVVGALLAFGVTLLMTPVYTSSTIQLVKGQPGTGAAANYEAAQYAVSRAKSYPPFVYSSTVLEGVRSDLGNTVTISELRNELSATNPVSTPLLEITATGATPEEARDKANSAARHTADFITDIETVGGRSPITVELAVDAALPTVARSPQTLVITALGAMVGFGLALVIALINTYSRDQRLSAFRRRAAMTWLESEGASAAAVAPPAGMSEVTTAPPSAPAAPPEPVGPAATEPLPAADPGAPDDTEPLPAADPVAPDDTGAPPEVVRANGQSGPAPAPAPQPSVEITADDDAPTEVIPQIPVDGAERAESSTAGTDEVSDDPVVSGTGRRGD